MYRKALLSYLQQLTETLWREQTYAHTKIAATLFTTHHVPFHEEA